MDVREFSRKVSFRDLIEKKAADTPDHILIHETDTCHTYREVNMCADILACDLAEAGVKKGSHVGIYCPNSANWISSFFAIQKLGAIAILINPAITGPEVAMCSEIGDITHLCYGDNVTDYDSFINELKEKPGNKIQHFINVGKNSGLKERESDKEKVEALLGFRPQNDDPAVMLFTSGSTGKPKCALLSAYNILLASYESMVSQRLTEEDRICNILPLFHVFGLVSAMCAAFLSDAEMYIPSDIHTDTLIDTIYRYKCTVFNAVPTMMLMILENRSFAPEKLKTLRCTILSAAAATREQIERLHEALPDDHFLSAYGLSESAPISTLPYDDTLENCINTVGVPMPHVKIEIRHPETDQKCSQGEIGEIVVKSENLMTAYYRVRIEDQSLGGDGWLHTGDLGYIRDDGYLCFTGRLKELIIRGGESIYPNEVASVISMLPGIDDVKVVGVQSDFYGEEVCACIKLEKGASFDEAVAREKLKKVLARFKIPSFFVLYDKFPLLATGKVDMMALKKDVQHLAKRMIK